MDLARRWFFGPFLLLLIFAIPIKLFAFGFFGQYRGWWRYVGISDLIYIAKAAILSAIIIMILWFAYGQFGGLVLPRSLTEKLSKRIEPLERLQVQIKLVDRGLNNLSTNQGQYKDNIRWTTDGIDRFNQTYDDLAAKIRKKKDDIDIIKGIINNDVKSWVEEIDVSYPIGLDKEQREHAGKLRSRLSKARSGINKYVTNLQSLRDFVELSQIRDVFAEANQKRLTDQERVDVENRAEALRVFWSKIHGVIMLDLFATIMLLSGVRMIVRLYHEQYFAGGVAGVKKFLIVGAGDAGEALLREMTRIKASDYEVMGFVDDDPAKRGTRIHGVTVLGKVDKLPEICEEKKIDEIGIAMPSATHKELRHVVQVCQGTKIRFRTVPSITDIASGKLRVSQIRDVDINDLLGRDVVELDLDDIQEFLKGKVIFVTGAGGSIGSEMCRQVCNFEPKLLLLAEQAENPLFFIERELRRTFPDVALKALVCDITDKQRVEKIFQEYKPQVLIHAAAHKHVPLMETNPGEAVKNNVIGTMTVANAADSFGVDNFVMISTDKAVNPTSIMGSTKRVAEMYIQDMNCTSQTHFVTVRFGNVLGSNGSVVPIFKNQIAAGGPVTVTHPEMTRYFMTIPEASQLVLQAATMGNGGEIFVLDMGEPVKIVDLARELITLSGFRPGEDIEIVFSGTRPGEKLFEELSIEGEDMAQTSHPKIGVWKNIPKDRETLRSEIEKLVQIAHTQNYESIVAAVKTLIPEYLGDRNNGHS
jgi:FlaA1/EpsC-like NDP-sugar epimerase